MSNYGVQPTGYVRKPLAVILAELEAVMITEFGPGVIQTPQSPLGQLNGLVADMVAEIEERNLDLYQSYDPDQAEGARLDILGRLRLLNRGDETEDDYRRAITNEGQSRIDIQDMHWSIKTLDGVEFVQVFVNETGEFEIPELSQASVAVAVIGGDDNEIANVVRKYVVPGISTYGNYQVYSNIDGFCRTLSIIRPILVPVTLQINLRVRNDRYGCPAPSPTAVKNVLAEGWMNERVNGKSPSFYSLRTIIEGAFSNVELTDFTGFRDGQSYFQNQDVPISFIEIAGLDTLDMTVTIQS